MTKYPILGHSAIMRLDDFEAPRNAGSAQRSPAKRRKDSSAELSGAPSDQIRKYHQDSDAFVPTPKPVPRSMSFLHIFETAIAAISLFLSGTICGVSMLAVPVALETAKSEIALVQQWKAIYFNGHVKGPAIALTVGAAMGAIAALKHTDGQDPTTSVFAAVAAAAIVPYTWVVMSGVNRTLHAAAITAGPDKVDAERLVLRWSRMNVLRGALPSVGGLVSLWGVISR